MGFIDLTGQKFNRLTVLELDYIKGNRTYWKCQCVCGNIISVRADSIKNGHAKSCGCIKRENLKKNPIHYKHGQRKERIYRVWSLIIVRCYNKKVNSYKNYGGRGIKVCDEWCNDFMAFYNWAMANGYKDNLTIDRIDNNGNYEPSNCRWATVKEQANNRRTNKLYEINGKVLNISQISEKYNIDYKLLWKRLKSGWCIEDAVNTPKRK